MKIIKSILLSALFCVLPTHALFEFTHGTQLALTNMLHEAVQAGAEHRVRSTNNPAFKVCKEMQTTISEDRLSTITGDEDVSSVMHRMQQSYQADDSYNAVLAAAQNATQEKKNDFAAWGRVRKVAQQSIIDYTQKHSSFQYPTTQRTDYYTSLFDLNYGAESHDAHVFKASILMTFYQQQQCEALQIEAMQPKTSPLALLTLPRRLFVWLFTR